MPKYEVSTATNNIKTDTTYFFHPLTAFGVSPQEGLKVNTIKILMKSKEAVNAGTLNECPPKFNLTEKIAVIIVRKKEIKRAMPKN